MGYTPQRIYEARFAWAPFIESAFGTVLIDAKFTHATQPQGFDPPGIARQFRSDIGKAWGGTDRATTRTTIRQDLSYPLNFELSALLVGHIAACCLGADTPTLKAAGPPTAYEHVITFQDPLVDGLDLPSTGHWFKPADDLGLKTKGAVCSDFTISYTQGQPVVNLASNWIGNGDYVNVDIASVPALDLDAVLGILAEKDLVIKMGAPGSLADISDRVAAFSLQVGNGVGETEKHFAGTGLYAGRAWQGKRIINPSLTIYAKATDDILDLFEDDTVQGLEFTWTGDTITGSEHFKLKIEIPALHFGNPLKIGTQGNYVVWDLSPGDEGVFQPTAAEPITITVENEEATFLVA